MHQHPAALLELEWIEWAWEGVGNEILGISKIAFNKKKRENGNKMKKTNKYQQMIRRIERRNKTESKHCTNSKWNEMKFI